jgi:hypothetical protein
MGQGAHRTEVGPRPVLAGGVEGGPAGTTLTAVEGDQGPHRYRQMSDGHRALGAEVHTDPAPGTGVRVQPVGIGLGPNGPLGAQPRAGIAAGAAGRVDLGREGDQLPGASGRKPAPWRTTRDR